MKQFIAQLTPNGMERIEQPALVKGQLVHYHSTVMASHSPYVVTGVETPYGMEALSIPSEFHPEIIRATISASDLLHYAERADPDDYEPRLDVPDPDDLKAAYDDQRKRAQEEARERDRQRQELEKKGRAVFESRRPSWAKAVIVAQYEVDKSDSMTDYFATSTSRTVFLAWSKHTRNIFSEMRKAAANFDETKHLAKAPEVDENGERRTERNKSWWTPADEHRENWSMGAGYYLKASYKYSTGWIVKKLDLGYEYGTPYAAAANEDNWRIPDSSPQNVTESPQTDDLPIYVESYSEKALVVRGDTRPHSEALREIGGRFNPRLQGGPGWIFSKAKHTDKVTAFIAQTILAS